MGRIDSFLPIKAALFAALFIGLGGCGNARKTASGELSEARTDSLSAAGSWRSAAGRIASAIDTTAIREDVDVLIEWSRTEFYAGGDSALVSSRRDTVVIGGDSVRLIAGTAAVKSYTEGRVTIGKIREERRAMASADSVSGGSSGERTASRVSGVAVDGSYREEGGRSPVRKAVTWAAIAAFAAGVLYVVYRWRSAKA